MRRIRSVLCAAAIVAAFAGGFAPPALAGRLDDCNKPPPAWFTAPLRTHSTSHVYGAGYARAHAHEYSAQRRSYTAPTRRYAPQRHSYRTRSYSVSPSFRFRDPFGRR